MRGTSAVVASALVVAFISACNTDPIWEPAQKAEGPTTPIDKPSGVTLPDIRISDVREVDIVESVLMHRAQYVRSLRTLRDYYAERGYDAKRIWAEQELEDTRRIRPYRYITSSEIPPEHLTPTDSVAAADDLYARAMKLMDEGGHGVPIFYRENKMKEALSLLRTLIETHPNSDKIDDAAFFCGEILKEYFKDQEQLAVKWYERSMEWDPKTPHPVRFQAAVIYDLRMYDRDRALELYHQAIELDPENKSNASFAMRRITELTEQMQPDLERREAAAFAPESP